MNKNIIGKRYGRLVVIDVYTTGRRTYCVCNCDCGSKTTVDKCHLVNGNTKSCGCFQKEKVSKQFTKHGKSTHPLCGVWQTMKQRCYNPNNKSYKNYGARGITVCEEWKKDFKLFYDWATNNGYKKGLTLDRVDTNGNYEPSNCRWVEQVSQQNNRRNNIIVLYNGVSYTLSELSKKTNIKYATLRNRIKNLGWDVERALRK